MRRKILGSIQIALVAIILATPVWAQPPQVLWTRTLDTGGYDVGFSIKQTSDGGFIVGGGGHQAGFWLIKLDPYGNTQWDYNYGGGGNCFEVQQTTDGGYIMAGYNNSNDAMLVRTDGAGNPIWNRLYGWGDEDDFYSVQQTNDGEFIIGGATHSGVGGGLDFWLVKINGNGDFIWTNTFGGSGIDRGQVARQTTDGGYILVGTTNSFGAGSNDIWLIKTDSLGNEIWQHTYGGSGNDVPGEHGVEQTFDGGYILCGYTSSYGAGNEDYWLIKTDANGDTLWTRTYGGTSNEEGTGVQQTSDGGFILCGGTTSYGVGGMDYWIVKTDAAGDTLWSSTYGGPYNDIAFEIRQTTDGGYVTVGDLHDNWYAGTSDIYIVRLEGPAIGPTIELDPIHPPLVIPLQGGSFQFSITLSNTASDSQTFYAWCNVQLPNGLQYTVLGPFAFTFSPGLSVTRTRTQVVPANAPTGEYIYWGCVGTPPWIVADRDSFRFVKEGIAADWPGLEGWSCTGEPFPGEVAASSQPTAYSLVSVSPNPFNPTTVIRYQIQDTRHVSLKVYDTAGRLVATLVEGWQEAGNHQVTFDGSKLTSGLYLVRMQAGEFSAVEKMMLVK